MRANYTDDPCDEEYPGQFDLWQANCRRSLRGRKGVVALRALEAALVALPKKELHEDVLVEPDGACCGIGAMLVERKVQSGMLREDAIAHYSQVDGYNAEQLAIDMLDVPKLVAWSMVVQNDEEHVIFEKDAARPSGYRRVVETPAQRYERMLKWVRKELSHGQTAA